MPPCGSVRTRMVACPTASLSAASLQSSSEPHPSALDMALRTRTGRFTDCRRAHVVDVLQDAAINVTMHQHCTCGLQGRTA
jgi:hypothetical protein